MDLRSTLNLPDQNFTIPMKANLPALEPEIQKRWDEDRIYHRIQEARKDAPLFVYHDGPPYTNSPIHIGTALNKILKDFVVKSYTMMGFRTPYIPGYDNHGLPIEQAVMKAFHEKKVTPTVVELRKACREHAAKYIKIQTEQFKRLGVFGLWERPYTTMDFRFEAEIIRVFKRLVEGGYIYRGLRSTLWSPTSRTALADTEIIYQDHTSKAIYVRFPLWNDPNKILTDYPNLYTVIWTTTPWTIPANLGVTFHPDLTYAVVKVDDLHYLVYQGLVEKLTEKLGWQDAKIVGRFDGINFDRIVFKHPIFDRESLGMMGEYVTTEDGTGVVHTAPGHGRDDFMTGQKYGLPVLSPVDERGYLTGEAHEFAGVFYKDCDKVVVERLAEVGNLLQAEDYHHSYPYAERDNQPVIFRATEQWYVSLDHKNLRGRALDEIRHIPLDQFNSDDRPKHGVCWVPESGYNRISSMVAHRPDWCISRQRPWGVGIPVFYGAKSRAPVLDPEAIEAVAQLVEREGSDAWFEKPASEILPAGYKHPETGETEFEKETDVLDVWFDSGSTSLAVYEGNVEPEWKDRWPTDLYLEGSDQHRGWFNSSLFIGMAVKGAPPYRQVVTHGFVTDGEGRKMSKRLGNVVEPVDACDQYGADVLRYWVASVDYANDVPCSDSLLKQFGEHYRKVRNTLRFLLSNLYDFSPDEAPVETMDLDEWVMEQADLLVADCIEQYRRYDYNKVITAVHNFCANELSEFYLDSIKDRMYCDGSDWPTRRSGQAACYYVLVRLLKIVAPILMHTAEETWARVPGASGSIHTQVFDMPSTERLAQIEDSDLQRRFAVLLDERSSLNAAFETWKTAAGVKDSQDAIATIKQQGRALELLRSFTTEELATYFKMSWVELSEGAESFSFRPSEFPKCERSRLRRPDVEPVLLNGQGEVPLTRRDRRALGL